MNEKLKKFFLWLNTSSETAWFRHREQEEEWNALVDEMHRVVQKRLLETMPGNYAEVREVLDCHAVGLVRDLFPYEATLSDFWRVFIPRIKSFVGSEERLLHLVADCMRYRLSAMEDGIAVLYRPEMLAYYATGKSEALAAIVKTVTEADRFGLTNACLPQFLSAAAPVLRETDPALLAMVRESIVRLTEIWGGCASRYPVTCGRGVCQYNQWGFFDADYCRRLRKAYL